MDVDAFLKAKLRDGASPNSVRIMRTTLSKALGAAERWSLVTRNVAALSESVKIGRSEARAMSSEQATVVLGRAAGERLGLCYVLSMIFGLRRCEALGLRWSDVDWAAGTILVCGNVIRRSADPRIDAGVETKTVLERRPVTKTSKSYRRIVLTTELVESLRKHRAKQHTEQLKAGPLWESHDLIFASERGTLIDVDNYSRRFGTFCEHAGIGRWSPHSMRHSAVSLMLAQGTPLHVVSEIVGHSSIAVTKDVYGHLVDGEKGNAAALLLGALNPMTEAS